MFILCSQINKTNYDETLLLSILSKFKLTSLVVCDGNKDKNIFMKLLKIPLIQETLEHFKIFGLISSKCIYVVELLVEFKRINTIGITWFYSKDDDKIVEWKQEIRQFKKELKKKHSEIEIYIGCIQKIH